MKTTTTISTLCLLFLGAVHAREHNDRPRRMPPPPIIAALDADRDGVISAEEIRNAAATLETLDENGDGQLTPDEIMPQGPPPRPPHHGPDDEERD